MVYNELEENGNKQNFIRELKYNKKIKWIWIDIYFKFSGQFKFKIRLEIQKNDLGSRVIKLVLRKVGEKILVYRKRGERIGGGSGKLRLKFQKE